MGTFQLFQLYPIATLSSAVAYMVLLLLCFPQSRRFLEKHLTLELTPGRKHLCGFDALRGFSAAYIALAHCWNWTYPVFVTTQLSMPMLGYASKAVAIFAALSGYLIYLSVRKIETIDDIRYYGHSRLIRIMPVYIASFLILYFIDKATPIAGTEGHPLEISVSQLSLFISQISMFYVFGFPAFANQAVWSVYVELLFYIFMPLYIACIGKWRLSAACISLLLFMIPASVVTVRTFDLWVYFFWGILAAEVSFAYKDRIKRWWPSLTLLVGLVFLAIDLQGPSYDPFSQSGLLPRDDIGYTIGLGVAMFLILTGLPHAKTIGRWMDVLPLRILGAISYSLFLLHPIYIAVNFPGLQIDKINQQYDYWKTFYQPPDWYLPFVFFPGVLVWAALMFVLIERPFIHWGRGLRKARD